MRLGCNTATVASGAVTAILHNRIVEHSSTNATEGQNLAALLVRTARRYPSLPALAIGAHGVATYAQLARRVASIAATLRRNLHRGDLNDVNDAAWFCSASADSALDAPLARNEATKLMPRASAS